MHAIQFIPFRPEFREAILSGMKTMTTRNNSYGRTGDRLTTPFGVDIQLLEVRRVTLGDVADHYYRQEGCDSPQDFIRIWREIHPSGFYPNKWVWLHIFRVVK